MVIIVINQRCVVAGDCLRCVIQGRDQILLDVLDSGAGAGKAVEDLFDMFVGDLHHSLLNNGYSDSFARYGQTLSICA